MRIAVTAQQPSLDAAVDPRFGRCPCFVVVETETLDFEVLENPNVMLGGGAGIQSSQLMAEKGVQCVLTGNCGPNAYQTLSAVGIQVIVGCSGVVRDVVEQFKANRLRSADVPNVASHFGTSSPPPQEQAPVSQQPPMTSGGMGMGGGAGRGMGRGGGMGRGMGRGMGGGGGMGRGMGRGRGMGMGAGGPVPGVMPNLQPPQGTSKEEELAMLRQQAEAMRQQSQQIQERIRQLENED